MGLAKLGGRVMAVGCAVMILAAFVTTIIIVVVVIAGSV